MKRWKKIVLSVVAIFGVLTLTAVLLIWVKSKRDYQQFKKFFGPAVSYEPDCLNDDASCNVWIEFRHKHPYPYQSIAYKRLSDGTFALIVSEPAPTLAKDDLDTLIEHAFGSDLISSQRLQWYIGTDGWVEDLVLRIKGEQLATSDPMDDPVLRDRIALLDRALFGTTFGGDIELIGDTDLPSTAAAAPDIQVSPREVSTWMDDNSLLWYPVNGENNESRTWSAICQNGESSAFTSDDGRLVMLTFPTQLLIAGRHDSQTLASLQVPFRAFAIASEAVLGGVWTRSGQVAILARVRTKPLNVLPPLRFETFALLASQSSDELSQSYERNAVFAGKLQSGDYILRDWAPVYLSEPLIDTEFGALLNITDQMLKSWSEAGAIEYLYFTYPKPGSFPFNGQALSDILSKKVGSESVLFNWNTAGSAVVVKGPSHSTLTAKRTGALPVTYGANGIVKEAGGEDLFEYEEEAYNYFASLKNPNLARVVQYTVLYQLFRAIANESPDLGRDDLGDPPNEVTGIPARAQGIALLVRETTQLLDDLDAGKVTASNDPSVADLIRKLQSFRTQFPDFDNVRLAEMLADRFSSEAKKFQKAQVAETRNNEAALIAEGRSLQNDIDSYNSLVQQVKSSGQLPPGVSATYIQQTRASLDQRDADLQAKVAAVAKSAHNPVGEIRQALCDVASNVRDLEEVRAAFVDSNAADADGSIKTPSIVVSWNSKETLTSVGGHNLDARALLFEPSPEVSDLALVEGKDGDLVLRYNPSRADMVEAHANELARAVEHRGERDPNVLIKLAETPVETRSRSQALELPEPHPMTFGGEKGFGRLGGRFYAEKKPFVDDIRTIAERNKDCVFVARDEEQIAYVAEENPHPPPGVRIYEVRDTPSLVDHLALISKRAGARSGKAIIFFDEPEPHVQALALDVSEAAIGEDGLTRIADSLGKRSSGRVSAIEQSDLQGNRSVLETIAGAIEVKSREILERLGVLEPARTWREAKVSELDPKNLEDILLKAGWDNSKDGMPTAIKVSFVSGTTQTPPDVAVVAGFSDGDLVAGRSQLVTTHNDAVASASDSGASLAQYLMTVRNQLKSIPHSQLRRLLCVVQDKETKVLFTRLEVLDGVTNGS